jgi:hypothetical protein
MFPFRGFFAIKIKSHDFQYDPEDKTDKRIQSEAINPVFQRIFAVFAELYFPQMIFILLKRFQSCSRVTWRIPN